MSDFQTLAANTYPGSLATNKWNGHYYGLPLDTNTRVLITNPTALASAGITTPAGHLRRPQGRRPQARRQEDLGVRRQRPAGLERLPLDLVGRRRGRPALTAPRRPATSTATPASPACRCSSTSTRPGAIPNLIIGNKGATQTSDGLPKGQYADILDGPWMAGIWAGQYPTFKPDLLPGPGRPRRLDLGRRRRGHHDVRRARSTRTLPRRSSRFTQTATYQLAMAKTGQMSVVKSLDAQEAALVPAVAPYIKQLQTAKQRPAVPEASQIDTVLSDELTKAFQGSESVKDALTKAASQIDPLLTAKK